MDFFSFEQHRCILAYCCPPPPPPPSPQGLKCVFLVEVGFTQPGRSGTQQTDTHLLPHLRGVIAPVRAAVHQPTNCPLGHTPLCPCPSSGPVPAGRIIAGLFLPTPCMAPAPGVSQSAGRRTHTLNDAVNACARQYYCVVLLRLVRIDRDWVVVFC